MARTVIDIAQAAADVVGLDDVTALVNNREPAARALLRLLDRAGRNMARMRNSWGGGWTTLTREHVFTTADGVEEYALPEDFEALIDGTLWDRTSYREMRGTLTPQEWQQARSGLIQTVSIAPLYRIRGSSTGVGRSIYLEPIPTTEDTLVMEYVSGSWLQSGNDRTMFVDRISTDADIPLFDDDLMEMDLEWRFKQSRGLTFAAELAEWEMERDRRFAADSGPRTIVLGQGRRRTRWPNTPETGFGGGFSG